MSKIVLLVVMVGSALFCQESEQRTWTDNTGGFSVEATMEVDAADKLSADVVLIKSNGKTITVPLERLSEESRNYVRKVRRAARKIRDSAPATQSQELPAEQKPNSQATDASKVWNWRGPRQDGIADESELLSEWPADGPKLLWTANGLGNAMSSVSIADGKIFTLGNRDGGEYLIACNLEDGSELWATRIGAGGESNSTPTVDGDRVYAVGLAGDLACLNVNSGAKVWSKSFANDFGGRMMSQWGYSESPLVDGDRLICTPGGPDAMIAALNKKTGETIWATPMRPGGDRGTDGAGYSSIVISEGGGVKQYITLVGRGLISVAAKDGKPLWQYERIANGTANVPTPIVDGDYVFCSSGYDDGGTALLRLSANRGNVGYQEIYYLRANELQNHHGGMIKIGDYVYMGEGHNRGFPMCVEFKTGRRIWEKQRGAGSGSAAIVAADDHLYFRYENGVMALVEANANEYRLKGQFEIATRNRESWPHPVIYQGRLYLRDQGQLHCYDISKQ